MHIFDSTMSKKSFKEFSEQQDLPFSLSYSWWNEVVRNNWDVAVVENQGELMGIWPYIIRKKAGFTFVGQAEITPYCGPYIFYPTGQKNHSRFSYEKKILEKLIEQFPPYDHFEQKCHLNFQNALPLIWKGFQQSVNYTYIINDLSDLQNVYASFAGNIKREIKKAEKNNSIIECEDMEEFIPLISSTFDVQNQQLPISRSSLLAFYKYIQKHRNGKIWLAKDNKNQPVAGLTIIWDNDTAYYLLGGAAKEYKNSGAMSLLMWHAIQYSSTNVKVKKFNFEGSMIPAIEKFLRAFGGQLTAYNKLTHNKSSLLQLIKYFKNKISSP